MISSLAPHAVFTMTVYIFYFPCTFQMSFLISIMSALHDHSNRGLGIVEVKRFDLSVDYEGFMCLALGFTLEGGYMIIAEVLNNDENSHLKDVP